MVSAIPIDKPTTLNLKCIGKIHGDTNQEKWVEETIRINAYDRDSDTEIEQQYRYNYCYGCDLPMSRGAVGIFYAHTANEGILETQKRTKNFASILENAGLKVACYQNNTAIDDRMDDNSEGVAAFKKRKHPETADVVLVFKVYKMPDGSGYITNDFWCVTNHATPDLLTKLDDAIAEGLKLKAIVNAPRIAAQDGRAAIIRNVETANTGKAAVDDQLNRNSSLNGGWGKRVMGISGSDKREIG